MFWDCFVPFAALGASAHSLLLMTWHIVPYVMLSWHTEQRYGDLAMTLFEHPLRAAEASLDIDGFFPPGLPRSRPLQSSARSGQAPGSPTRCAVGFGHQTVDCTRSYPDRPAPPRPSQRWCQRVSAAAGIVRCGRRLPMRRSLPPGDPSSQGSPHLHKLLLTPEICSLYMAGRERTSLFSRRLPAGDTGIHLAFLLRAG